MRIYDLIQKKKDGGKFTREEINFIITEYVEERVPDYQMSALLMAIYFKGMDSDETVWLTQAMEYSGNTVDLSMFGLMSADKHSTGGVGDKTSLIVLPIVASIGGKIAKMSGRGLGHTGGTVDKLESIPGYNANLNMDDFIKQVEKIGISIIGQTGNLVPADKKLYALRDVTATVDSIPLITSSIMSKKLAAGSENIVLDVKCGDGAFMKDVESAKKLAQAMVDIGKKCGRSVTALITDMDKPLGNAIGNALEVKEAISVLRGKSFGDLGEVCVKIAAEMIAILLNISSEDAESTARGALKSGMAYAKFKEWIEAQGGSIEDFYAQEESEYKVNIAVHKSGYIHEMKAEAFGRAAALLGAGRKTKQDAIDHSAGIVLNKKVGDYVKEGDILFTLHTNKHETVMEATKICMSAISISNIPVEESPLVYEVIK